MRARLFFCVVFTCCSSAIPAVYIKGKVISSLGFAIGSATVQLSGSGASSQTDAEGKFILTSSSSVSANSAVIPKSGNMEFNGPMITMSNLEGKKVSISIYNGLGRKADILQEQIISSSTRSIEIDQSHMLTSGMYVFRAVIDNNNYTFRFMVIGQKISWPHVSLVQAITSALAKPSASYNLSASATGYENGTFSLLADTVFDITLTLCQVGIAAASPVTVTEGTLTKDFTLRKQNGGSTYNWFRGRVYSWSNYSVGSVARKTFKVIYLENRFVKVSVSPDLGMRVLRVEDKVSGNVKDLFSVYDSYCQGWPPGNNTGGVKPSFPFYENASPIIDDNGNFIGKAGYFIENNPDGSVSVVMNGRYDHHQLQQDIGFLGRYGDRPLSTIVTLKPDDISFNLRYVADNPNPLRRSNRIWTDAIVPTSAKMEWLFPTKYEISHGAVRINNYQANGLDMSFSSRSHFALRPEYPFAGVYYPDNNTNLIRAGDPVKYPGTKIYDNIDDPVKELWGSTNVVFEAPDTFVQAYEPFDLEYSYYLVRSIGKVTYANQYIAIAASNKSFKLITTRPAYITVFDYNASSSPIALNAFADPATTVIGTFTNGLRIVANGKELCNIKIPLVFADDSSSFKVVTIKSKLSGGWSCYTGAPGPAVDSNSLDARWGYNYELEGSQNKHPMMNSMAAIMAANRVSQNDNPGVLISIANTAYRHGAFAAANTILAKLGSKMPQEANYLKALMALESGQTADLSNTIIEGNYLKALQKIKANNTQGAISDLDALIAARPNTIRPRLVRGYLKRDISDVLRCLDMVPGSVEAYAVLKELGYSGAGARLTGLLQQDAMATIRKDDFLKEIKSGDWRHERRFEYSLNMFRSWANVTVQKTPVPMPEFPASLRYIY